MLTTVSFSHKSAASWHLCSLPGMSLYAVCWIVCLNRVYGFLECVPLWSRVLTLQNWKYAAIPCITQHNLIPFIIPHASYFSLQAFFLLPESHAALVAVRGTGLKTACEILKSETAAQQQHQPNISCSRLRLLFRAFKALFTVISCLISENSYKDDGFSWKFLSSLDNERLRRLEVEKERVHTSITTICFTI